jgi:hypothetical protein
LSLMRRRRLEALERRQIRGPVYRDPFPTIERLSVDLQAVVAGRAEWIPRSPRELGEDEQAALALAIRTADLMADRLQAERAREL